MTTATLTRCACEHCHCEVSEATGYLYEGQLYCSQACATHDHQHPSACCQDHGCCH